jgi:predicted nuclease of predicted toxin-antitoxin system
MEIWIDAQLSPAVALWINSYFKGVKAQSMRALGLRDADDITIFMAAKKKNAVLMSKDIDFVTLLERLGPPPQIIWIKVGNTSNSRMREILIKHFSTIKEMLIKGEQLIEIDGV